MRRSWRVKTCMWAVLLFGLSAEMNVAQAMSRTKPTCVKGGDHALCKCDVGRGRRGVAPATANFVGMGMSVTGSLALVTGVVFLAVAGSNASAYKAQVEQWRTTSLLVRRASGKAPGIGVRQHFLELNPEFHRLRQKYQWQSTAGWSLLGGGIFLSMMGSFIGFHGAVARPLKQTSQPIAEPSRGQSRLLWQTPL